ncbi:MAG: sugar phosphate nucleotidyltransferase [Nitrospirota bacterium]|nr:sugar phosphate nucleotidyltransferase [Nitrospirota bacterium]MDH5698867.1 sugar phosphate nucleotidyltransferase [Nitrospirota bacterium]
MRVESNPLWSIILAGGEGERTRPFIEQWLGCHKPKQYCTFVGNRSMLQHTLDRADRLVRPEHKVTVIGRNHREFVNETLEGHRSGHVILQPRNCGTAAGVFLPLTFVRAWDPEATVVIFPSDHFVFPEARFLETVRRGIRASHILQDRLILFGVRPSHLELDYGWINVGGVLGRSGGSCVRLAGSFLEKPDPMEGLQAMANGALWNTLVIVAKVSTLWKLGWQSLPGIMERFERLGARIGTVHEGETLQEIYQDMPSLDFSCELLQRVPEHLGVMELEEVLWSDWGKPERIVETLKTLGKKPAFPSEILQRPTSPLHSISHVEVT